MRKVEKVENLFKRTLRLRTKEETMGLRGEGGGSSLKKLNFLVKSYVVALVLVFPKWAHLSLNSNSKQLSRYDVTKLTLSRAFSQTCIGNSLIFVPNFNLRKILAVW